MAHKKFPHGVYYDSYLRSWSAQVLGSDDVPCLSGDYPDPMAAAKLHDRCALKAYGEEAQLNLPRACYRQTRKGAWVYSDLPEDPAAAPSDQGVGQNPPAAAPTHQGPGRGDPAAAPADQGVGQDPPAAAIPHQGSGRRQPAAAARGQGAGQKPSAAVPAPQGLAKDPAAAVTTHQRLGRGPQAAASANKGPVRGQAPAAKSAVVVPHAAGEQCLQADFFALYVACMQGLRVCS